MGLVKIKTPKTKKVVISEHAIQAACFDFVRAKEQSDPRYSMIYAIPNGGHRHISVARKLKREGVKAGVWDVAVDVPMRGFHGMRLEFKSEKGKLTAEQIKMGELYLRYGYVTSVIRNFAQFRSVIEAYLYEPERIGS